MYEPKFTGPPIKALKATAGGYKRRPWSLVGARLRSWLYASMACAAMLILQGCTGIPSSKWGSESRLAPILNQNAKSRIPDQYIIVFKPGSDREAVVVAQATVKRLGGTIRHTGKLAPLWFSAKMPAEAVSAMRAAPGVNYIEADTRGTGSVTQCC